MRKLGMNHNAPRLVASFERRQDPAEVTSSPSNKLRSAVTPGRCSVQQLAVRRISKRLRCTRPIWPSLSTASAIP
jgi:hypothetical protein